MNHNEKSLDPITGARVFYSSSRGKRPNNYKNDVDYAPFEKGSEHLTPDSLLSLPDAIDWEVRVVPNKFTPFSIKSAPYGMHEVLIEAPHASEAIADFSRARLEMIFRALLLRVASHYEDEKIKYTAIFKNSGENSGATLTHPHMQLVGLDYLPIKIETMLKNKYDFFIKNGISYLRSLVDSELEYQKRIVLEEKNYLVFCPKYSITPMQVDIIPKCNGDFLQATETIEEIAGIMGTVYALLQKLSLDSFNAIFYVYPNMKRYSGVLLEDFYDWHISILPRDSRFAGFELTCGDFINGVLPDDAAMKYKDALESFA